MKKKRTVKSHPLIQTLHRTVFPELYQSLRQILEKANPSQTSRSRSQNARSVQKVNPYHVLVSKQAGHLSGLVENLRLSLFLIRRYPHDEFGGGKTLPHMKWINYHYSSFITGFVGIYDAALVLTNTVFQLGIPETRCRNDVVKENLHVRNTKVYAALRKLDNIIATHGPSRHAYVHRGEPPGVDEVISYWLQGIIKDEVSPRIGYDPVDPIFPHRLINPICRRLNRDVVNLEDALCEFLDALLAAYKDQVKLLRS
jgi:hypothetical protein